MNSGCFHAWLDTNSGPNYLQSLPVAENTVTQSMPTQHSTAGVILKLIPKL